MSVKLIAHVLLSFKDQFLIIKRSGIKRGQVNVFPDFWDIPGGSVEFGELPRLAAVRECHEETGIDITNCPLTIIHEDSQFDFEKEIVFTRLVYHCELPNRPEQIFLDSEEHTDFQWISLGKWQCRELVPYLYDILEEIRKG